MKKTKLFLLLAVTLSVLFSACGPSDEEIFQQKLRALPELHKKGKPVDITYTHDSYSVNDSVYVNKKGEFVRDQKVVFDGQKTFDTTVVAEGDAVDLKKMMSSMGLTGGDTHSEGYSFFDMPSLAGVVFIVLLSFLVFCVIFLISMLFKNKKHKEWKHSDDAANPVNVNGGNVIIHRHQDLDTRTTTIVEKYHRS